MLFSSFEKQNMFESYEITANSWLSQCCQPYYDDFVMEQHFAS